MMRKNVVLFFFLGIVFPGLVQAKNLVIATSGVTLTNVPIWIGIEKKFFEEAGYTVQYVGGDEGRITALHTKLVAAAVLQVPLNFAAHKLGAHTLLPLGEYLETLFAGLGASRKKVEQNREEVKKVIRSLVRSIDYMNARRAETIEIVQKRFGGMDRNVAEYIYGLVSKYATRDGIPSKKALENVLLGTPFEGKNINFADLADFSMAREVAAGK